MADARSEKADPYAARSTATKAGCRWCLAHWKVVVPLLLLAAISWPAAKIARIKPALAAVEAQGGQTTVLRSPDYEGSEVLRCLSWLIGQSRVRVTLTGRRTTDGPGQPPRGQRPVRFAARRRRGHGRGLKSLPDHQELQTLSLEGAAVGDAGLAELQHLTNLRSLCLTDTRATDKGMRAVAGLTGLRFLYLANTAVTDAGVRCVGNFSHLEALDLSRTRITHTGLRNLERLANLRQLILSGVRVSGVGLGRLRDLTVLNYLDSARRKSPTPT